MDRLGGSFIQNANAYAKAYSSVNEDMGKIAGALVKKMALQPLKNELKKRLDTPESRSNLPLQLLSSSFKAFVSIIPVVIPIIIIYKGLIAGGKMLAEKSKPQNDLNTSKNTQEMGGVDSTEEGNGSTTRVWQSATPNKERLAPPNNASDTLNSPLLEMGDKEFEALLNELEARKELDDLLEDMSGGGSAEKLKGAKKEGVEGQALSQPAQGTEKLKSAGKTDLEELDDLLEDMSGGGSAEKLKGTGKVKVSGGFLESSGLKAAKDVEQEPGSIGKVEEQKKTLLNEIKEKEGDLKDYKEDYEELKSDLGNLKKQLEKTFGESLKEGIRRLPKDHPYRNELKLNLNMLGALKTHIETLEKEIEGLNIQLEALEK